MAIEAEIPTNFGESRKCYIRLNSIEVSNHGEPSYALFRGFISKEAFESGAHYVWQTEVEFTPNINEPLWPQAYASLASTEGVSGQEI